MSDYISVYDATKSALHEMNAQGYINFNDAVKYALMEIRGQGGLDFDAAIIAENESLRKQLADAEKSSANWEGNFKTALGQLEETTRPLEAAEKRLAEAERRAVNYLIQGSAADDQNRPIREPRPLPGREAHYYHMKPKIGDLFKIKPEIWNKDSKDHYLRWKDNNWHNPNVILRCVSEITDFGTVRVLPLETEQTDPTLYVCHALSELIPYKKPTILIMP